MIGYARRARSPAALTRAAGEKSASPKRNGRARGKSAASPAVSRAALRPSGRLDDLDHDAGDVVARAGLQGVVAQPVGARLHLRLVLDEAQQLLVGDDAAEAVGAEQ